MIINLIAAALSTMPVSDTVPLSHIHADPKAYEGRIIETCGDAGGGDTLFLRNWVSGRSRGGFQLDRPVQEQGYVCVMARVVRVLPSKQEKQDVIVMSHPPVIPEGWQLQVLKVSKQR